MKVVFYTLQYLFDYFWIMKDYFRHSKTHQITLRYQTVSDYETILHVILQPGVFTDRQFRVLKSRIDDIAENEPVYKRE